MMNKKYLLCITTSFFVLMSGKVSALQRNCEEAYDDTRSVFTRTCHPLCTSTSCQSSLAACQDVSCKSRVLCYELGYTSTSCNSNEKWIDCPFDNNYKSSSLNK